MKYKLSGNSRTAKSCVRGLMRRFYSTEEGSIVPMAAISMTALVGGMALSAEAGVWYSHQRDVQSVADAAAFAGAFYLEPGNTATHTNATAEARAIAVANGFDENAAGSLIEVTFPGTDLVRVVVEEQQPRLLSSLFSKDAVAINARATAQIQNVMAPSCIVALNELTVGVTANGNAELNLTGCSLTSNTSAIGTDGVETNGKAIINAECIYVVNDAKISNASQVQCDNVQKYKKLSGPVPDPYGDIEFDPDAYCLGKLEPAPVVAGSVTYYDPGCYYSGLSLNSTSELAPGLYVLFGDLQVSGSDAIVGHGVTFAMAGNSSFRVSGASDVTLTPTTNTLAAGDPVMEQFVGILIFGDNRDGYGASVNTFSGNAGINIDGAIYVANGDVDVRGTSDASSDCLQVVAGSMTVAGTANMMTACEGKDYSLAGAAVDSFVALID